MVIFTIGVQHPLDVAVQGPHDTDAREHRRLPFRRFVLGLWQLDDVVASVLKGDDLAAPRQRDWFFERPIEVSPNFSTSICL
jgi:hypothetical protein